MVEESNQLQPSSSVHIGKNMTNLHINIGQEESTCQEKQTDSGYKKQASQYILKPNQKVYLYGDTSFSGTLIRPIERTYPPRWTVELDRGGYDSAIVAEIIPINPQYIETDLAIPFDEDNSIDTPTVEEQLQQEKERRIAQLEKEIEIVKSQYQQLEAKNQQLQNENKVLKKNLEIAKNVIRRAKDISPLMRISLKRVLRLAHDACMDVQRTVGGWILKMGDKARKFRRLADIWYILSQDNWYLSEIFAPDKLIAIDLIQPPRPRKPPVIPDKTTRPLMHPSDVIRNRTMFLVK